MSERTLLNKVRKLKELEAQQIIQALLQGDGKQKVYSSIIAHLKGLDMSETETIILEMIAELWEMTSAEIVKYNIERDVQADGTYPCWIMCIQ